MAEISINATIDAIRYLEKSILVYVSEPRNGYKKADGTKVEPTIWSWKCIFNNNARNTIGKYFGRGSWVNIRGDIQPFGLDKGEAVDGYVVWGKTINHAHLPKNIKREKQMIKESQKYADGTPDIEAYNQDDF